jgi:nickel-dependent lactate racemase
LQLPVREQGMKAAFSFGKRTIHVSVPESFRTQVIHSHTAQGLADERTALELALDAPIGCAPLAELAAGKKTAAISICDITRPAPNSGLCLHCLNGFMPGEFPWKA